MVYLVCIITYLVLLAVIAVWKSRDVKDQSDFAVAGRSLSPWMMVCTMLAVWIGTGSIVGNAEQTYETGMAALLLPVGTFIGMALLALIATRARSIEASTVPEIIERRFGSVARNLAMVSLVVAYMVIVSYQFNAGGAVLEVIVGEKLPTDVSLGDEISKVQLTRSRLKYTPEEDWTGEDVLNVKQTDKDASAAAYTVKLLVVEKDEVDSSPEEGTILVLKNTPKRVRFDQASLSGDRFLVSAMPERGSIQLVEPILTAKTATVIAAAFIISYAALAGLMSLAWMDLVTGSIIMLTMVISFPVYWFQAGGWSGMETAFLADHRASHMQLWGVY